MGFMQPEIVYGWFDIIEGKNGTEIYPDGTCDNYNIIEIIDDPTITSIEEAISECVYERVQGWFCRLQPHGYMDCTEWDGPFDSEIDALEHLDDTYGSDKDD